VDSFHQFRHDKPDTGSLAEAGREEGDNMLNRFEILLVLTLTSVFSFAISSSLSSAAMAITCSRCEVNNCVCTVEECSSGIMRIFSSSTCKIPSYEYTFYSYQFTWSIAPAGTYYLKALCEDGKITACSSITVKAAGTTTSSSTTSTTQPKVEKKDYTWIAVGVAAVAVAALVLIFFVFKKKPRKSFEELYRKWSK
jgi:ABC-type transport system involved in multi-copper enzyme maturation permease subunit